MLEIPGLPLGETTTSTINGLTFFVRREVSHLFIEFDDGTASIQRPDGRVTVYHQDGGVTNLDPAYGTAIYESPEQIDAMTNALEKSLGEALGENPTE